MLNRTVTLTFDTLESMETYYGTNNSKFHNVKLAAGNLTERRVLLWRVFFKSVKIIHFDVHTLYINIFIYFDVAIKDREGF